MNWIIKNTNKLRYHTDLYNLLKPIENEIKDLKWLVSDIEIIQSNTEKLPIDNNEKHFLISSREMDIIRKNNTQIVWGVFSGIDKNIELKIELIKLPYAEENLELWKNGNLQVKNSKIEIIAWDSSFTIVKFSDKKLSDKFKEFFDDAIELEKFQVI